MGLLRVLLALSVVAAHAPPTIPGLRLVGGQMAVEVFFVISGFYMQMVMASHRYPTARGFLISRALRLLPAYWIVALAVVLLSPGWLDQVQRLGAGAAALLLVSNIVVLFQDATLFLSAAGGSLSFSANIFADSAALYPLLLIPVAWTLSLEFYFYLMVPFLAARSTTTLIAIIVVASIGRVATYLGGYGIDPWTYRFFPFEIALFLCGMLAHRFYQRIDWAGFKPKTLSTIGWLCVAWFCLLTLARPSRAFVFVFAMSWALAIPFIFEITRRSQLDRVIGELSYPIYLVHLPLLAFAIPWLTPIPLLNQIPLYFLLSGMSIAAAALIWWLVDRPIDTLRHRLLTTPG